MTKVILQTTDGLGFVSWHGIYLCLISHSHSHKSHN
jgi:hypothetical protein